MNVKLTRSKLEQLSDPLIEKTVKPFEACLKDAGLSKSDIDELVLVGGMTRMPRVVETADKLAGKEAHKASIRTRLWRGARPFRAACCSATSATCCCSTSRP